jgi:hypothetical protein
MAWGNDWHAPLHQRFLSVSSALCRGPDLLSKKNIGLSDEQKSKQPPPNGSENLDI